MWEGDGVVWAYHLWPYDLPLTTALVAVGGGAVALVCGLIGLELITNS